MIRHNAFRHLVLSVAVAVAAACSTDIPTDIEHAAPAGPGAPLAAVTTAIGSTPCPPSVPAGYTLVFCFDFTTIPGVWHGFIVGSSIPPASPADLGQLSADYALFSPTGLYRLPPGNIVDVNQATYTFQAEFNGVTWFDVVRILTPASEPAQQLTIAVIKRALTPAVQAEAIVTQVSQLQAADVLNAGQASSLVAKLQNAIALLNAGESVPAAHILRAFVHQVSALMAGANPVLLPAIGQPLITAAEAVIVRVGGAPPGPFTGAWIGTYTFGPMSAHLLQTDGTVTGTITDAANCVWSVSGTVVGTSLSLPAWQLVSGGSPCPGATVTMSGSLDAAATTFTGSGVTTIPSAGVFPWNVTLTKVGP